MYFFIKGALGVAINQMAQKTVDSFFLIAQRRKGYQLIADHYVINRKRCDFIYVALEYCAGYGVHRRRVHATLDKFPDVKGDLQARVYKHYIQHTYKPLNAFRRTYITTRNERIGQMRDVQVQVKRTLTYPSVSNIQSKLQQDARYTLQQLV